MDMTDLGLIQLYLCLALAGAIMAGDMWISENR